jgi:hypothetical protein
VAGITTQRRRAHAFAAGPRRSHPFACFLGHPCVHAMPHHRSRAPRNPKDLRGCPATDTRAGPPSCEHHHPSSRPAADAHTHSSPAPATRKPTAPIIGPDMCAPCAPCQIIIIATGYLTGTSTTRSDRHSMTTCFHCQTGTACVSVRSLTTTPRTRRAGPVEQRRSLSNSNGRTLYPVEPRNLVRPSPEVRPKAIPRPSRAERRHSSQRNTRERFRPADRTDTHVRQPRQRGSVEDHVCCACCLMTARISP